ncbi:MAG: hypothetical protein GY851_14435 [bacterium]|nr:hypothetical protein [bacterium]
MSIGSRIARAMGVCFVGAFLLVALAGCPQPVPPVLNSVTPPEVQGDVATLMTLVGSSFQAGAQVRFTYAGGGGVIGTVPATFVSSNQLTCTSPVVAPLAAPAPVIVVVINPDALESGAGTVIYMPRPPVITTVTPTSVSAIVPTLMTVNGTEFQTGATYVVTRTVGGAIIGSGITTFVSANQLTFTSPTLLGLTASIGVTITITNPDGQADSDTSVTYLGPPSITSVAPTQVPATIATLLTINGTDFVAGAVARFHRPDGTVIGGGTVATAFVNATQLTCTTPVDLTLTVDTPVTVEVVNPDGQETIGGFKAVGTVTYVAPPTITGVITAPVAVSGQFPATLAWPFTVTGTNLSGCTVEFDLPFTTPGTPDPATGLSYTGDTQIDATSPPDAAWTGGPQNVTLRVIDSLNQPVTTTVPFHPLPSLTSLSATTIPSTIATGPITITGQYFRDGSTVHVRFTNATPAGAAGTLIASVSATFISSTSLTFTSPVVDTPTFARQLQDEAVSVTVEGPQTQLSAPGLAATYTAPPILNQAPINATFTPDPVTSTISQNWTIAAGDNFDTTSVDVIFTRQDTSTVIGTRTITPPTDAQNVSGTTGGGTGTPTVTGLTADITVLVQVQNQDGQISVPGEQITYTAPPIISNIWKTSFLPGQQINEVGATDQTPAISRNVTIDGANFQGGATVAFGAPASAAGTAVAVPNATTITTDAPALAPGAITTDTPVTVTVTNLDGQVSAGVTVNYQAEPHITTFASFFDAAFTEPIPGNVVPSSIAGTTYFRITDAAGNYVTEPGTAPAVVFTGQVTPTTSTSTGVTVVGENELTGQPQTVTITVDELFDLVVTDEYGQPSNTLVVEFTAPPIVELFEAQLPLPGFQPDVFGSTHPVNMRLTGDNFQANAVATFYDAPAGTAFVPTTTMATLSVDDTELTGGQTPDLTGLVPTTLTNGALVVTNPDHQSSAAYGGLKIVGLPEIYAVTLVGGDSATFIADGLFRNAHNAPGAGPPLMNGSPVTMHLTGKNLDSQTPQQFGPPPASRPPVALATGWASLALTGGALAVDGVLGAGAYPLGNDLARIVDDTAVQFELRDNVNGQLADVLGQIDVTSLTDWTGQTTATGITGAMTTIIGALAPSEGNAVGLATGEFTGAPPEDLAVVTGDAAGNSIKLTIFPGLVTGGYDLVTAYSTAIGNLGNCLTTPGAANVVVADLDLDTYDDIIVGIPGYDFINNTGNAVGDGGNIYIWYGTVNGIEMAPALTDLVDIAASAAVGAIGAVGLGEGFGAAIAVGDHNGDGFPDLLVGAPGTLNSNLNYGVVWYYQGTGTKLGNNQPPTGLAREIVGSSFTGGLDKPDYFGLGLALGDWDGDLDDEIFVGAPGYNDSTAGLDSGLVVAFYGDSNVDLAQDWQVAGAAAGATAGFATTADDLNGDAIADVMVGVPQFGPNFGPAPGTSGSVNVFEGRAIGTLPLHPIVPDRTFAWGGTDDNVGVASGLVPIAGTNEFLVTAPTIVAGALPGRAARMQYDAATPTFTMLDAFNKPQGVGFMLAGEMFGASTAYIDTGSGLDVFVAIPGAIGGARDGFVAIYPAGDPKSYANEDGEQAIPDQTTITSTIVVADSFTIADLNVRWHAEHTSAGDLLISLQSPAGTTVLLAALPGILNPNSVGTNVDDEASTPLGSAAAPFTGNFTPENPLSAFDGEDAAGTWTLTVEDAVAADVGTFRNWSMTFNSADNTPLAP